MTTESLYRFRCDAPGCDATAIGEAIRDVPADWRIVGSTDHIATTPMPVRGRRQPPSDSERHIGGFRIILCGAHHDAFAEHMPHTEGRSRRGADSVVSAYCSCGANLGWAAAVHILTADLAGPRNSAERLWWAHLPDDLKAYALRGTS